MPTSKHLTPNFNINSIRGWNTRLIYALYNTYDSAPVRIIDTSASDNIFTYIRDNYPGVFKGTFRFPPSSNRFFKTGKNFRIQSRLQVSTSGGGPWTFNVNAGMEGTIVASTNGGFNHNPPLSLTNCPVDLDLMYTFIELDDGSLYVQVNGSYCYCYREWDQNSQNTSICWVPIWNQTNPYPNYVSVGTNNGDQGFFIDFNNSVDIADIYIMYLTIEELT